MGEEEASTSHKLFSTWDGASLGANGPVRYPPVPLLSGAKRDACYIAVVRRV